MELEAITNHIMTLPGYVIYVDYYVEVPCVNEFIAHQWSLE